MRKFSFDKSDERRKNSNANGEKEIEREKEISIKKTDFLKSF